MCGLKLWTHLLKNFQSCHTLRGCVDWNNPSEEELLSVFVTPCVGVWIETFYCKRWFRFSCVTPCVGVWIETQHIIAEASEAPRSHPAWVCGLKPKVSPPFPFFYSHTLRGCVDWNSQDITIEGRKYASHPVWVCGLKRSVCRWAGFLRGVTPCVGVWIETPSTTWRRYLHMVTPCVGVYGLKHCSLVGQVYGRIVSIRPLVYFSSSCYKVKSQTKYVRLLTLLWLEKTRTIPDAYLLSVFFCGFT